MIFSHSPSLHNCNISWKFSYPLRARIPEVNLYIQNKYLLELVVFGGIRRNIKPYYSPLCRCMGSLPLLRMELLSKAIIGYKDILAECCLYDFLFYLILFSTSLAQGQQTFSFYRGRYWHHLNTLFTLFLGWVWIGSVETDWPVLFK